MSSPTEVQAERDEKMRAYALDHVRGAVEEIQELDRQEDDGRRPLRSGLAKSDRRTTLLKAAHQWGVVAEALRPDFAVVEYRLGPETSPPQN